MIDILICWSTIFGQPGDGYGGRTPTVLYGRSVSPADMGIAHRTWPMGSRIRITNLRTKKSATGVVLDRGPYGKLDASGDWFNSRRERSRVGKFRGCADLTPALAEAIGHDGKDKVKIERLKGEEMNDLGHREKIRHMQRDDRRADRAQFWIAMIVGPVAAAVWWIL
ncbi:MAG: hypothetical protein GY811_23415 [Myxococcales bacterium]|nr:hypothetical protein [Myxococcales bacterium]